MTTKALITSLITVAGNSINNVESLNGYTKLTKGKTYTLLEGGRGGMDKIVDDRGETILIRRHVVYSNRPITYGIVAPPCDECYATFNIVEV